MGPGDPTGGSRSASGGGGRGPARWSAGPRRGSGCRNNRPVGASGPRRADRIELRAIDPPKPHPVAWAQERGLGRTRIVEQHRRATENPEAARALDRVDATLDAADADAARRGLGARRVEPRDVDALGHPGHVRKPRREADEVDQIFGAGMEPHELLGRQLEPPGRKGEVEAELRVLVATGQLYD